MIVLDTHIWVWWVSGHQRLTTVQSHAIQANAHGIIGISAISCWEIAKLVELGRLQVSRPLHDWFLAALAYRGVQLLPITPEIAIESTELPGAFHSDPADQMIVATARIHQCPLLTSDGKIRAYRHVQSI